MKLEGSYQMFCTIRNHNFSPDQLSLIDLAPLCLVLVFFVKFANWKVTGLPFKTRGLFSAPSLPLYTHKVVDICGLSWACCCCQTPPSSLESVDRRLPPCVLAIISLPLFIWHGPCWWCVVHLLADQGCSYITVFSRQDCSEGVNNLIGWLKSQ